MYLITVASPWLRELPGGAVCVGCLSAATRQPRTTRESQLPREISASTHTRTHTLTTPCTRLSLTHTHTHTQVPGDYWAQADWNKKHASYNTVRLMCVPLAIVYL